MSERPISPLRQRMIEDMTVRKLGAATQSSYVRAVKTLSEFLGRSPATATAEDLRRFQVHQSEAGAQPSVMNNTVTALRFFFRVTLDRPEMARHLTLVRQARKLPSVLNEEEVVHLLEGASGLKYRAALGVAYGAGPCGRQPRPPASRRGCRRTRCATASPRTSWSRASTFA